MIKTSLGGECKWKEDNEGNVISFYCVVCEKYHLPSTLAIDGIGLVCKDCVAICRKVQSTIP